MTRGELYVNGLGVAGGFGAIKLTLAGAGVTGLSASGVASGLAAIGFGGMVGGVLTVAAFPLAGGCLAYAGCKGYQALRRRVSKRSNDKRLSELFADGHVTPEEMKELCDIASRNLRAEYTELGKPMVIEVDGATMLKYPDGRLARVVRNDRTLMVELADGRMTTLDKAL